jgi:hypothetical protein
MGKLSPSRGEIWWWDEPDRETRPVMVLAREEAIPCWSEFCHKAA